MGTCKASGKVKNRPRKMKVQGIRMGDQNRKNKHRLIPVKARGFHKDSLQLNMNRVGIETRYEIDKNGTIRRLKE